MNKFKNVTKLIGKSKASLKKNAPMITFIFGIGATVAGTIGLCKASVKSDKDLTESKDKIDKINSTEYETNEAKKADLAVVRKDTAKKLFKNYAVPGLIFGSGIGSLCFSHSTLTKRYIAATNAYAVLAQTFGEYRKRVAAKFGKDVERKIMIGDIDEKEDTIVTVNDDGTTSVSTEKKQVRKNAADGMYLYRFDKNSKLWNKKSMDYNFSTLRTAESLANTMVVDQGVVSVLDILKSIDIKPNAIASCTGWINDDSLDDYSALRQVSIGIDWDNQKNYLFYDENTNEPYILLNMLVDGPVIDWYDIPKEKIFFRRNSVGSRRCLIRSKVDAGLPLTREDETIIDGDMHSLDPRYDGMDQVSAKEAPQMFYN